MLPETPAPATATRKDLDAWVLKRLTEIRESIHTRQQRGNK